MLSQEGQEDGLVRPNSLSTDPYNGIICALPIKPENLCFSYYFGCFLENDLKLAGLVREHHAAGTQFFLFIPISTAIEQLRQTPGIEFFDRSQAYSSMPNTELENIIIHLFLSYSENTR